MSKKFKLLLVAILVMPMMFCLTACGGSDQLFTERVPMITIPGGEYVLTYEMANGFEYGITNGKYTNVGTNPGMQKLLGVKRSMIIKENLAINKQTVYNYEQWKDDEDIIWNTAKTEGYFQYVGTYVADAFGMITIIGDPSHEFGVCTYSNGKMKISDAKPESGNYGIRIFQLVE